MADPCADEIQQTADDLTVALFHRLVRLMTERDGFPPLYTEVINFMARYGGWELDELFDRLIDEPLEPGP